MIFAKLFKQTFLAAAIVALLTWLSTTFAQKNNHPTVGIIGYCHNVVDHECSKQGSYVNTTNSPGAHVLPYNDCIEWEPEYQTKAICSDVQCQVCTNIDVGKGRCAYFNGNSLGRKIRCVILA